MKSCFMLFFSPLLIVTKTNTSDIDTEYDKNGYIIYCPCMGRFGNQADHLLGSLAFAKKLDRTLVVPPWIGHLYKSRYENSFIPYDQWFDLKALQKYHRVIPMESFMKNLSSSLWPPQKRRVYCHQAAVGRSKDASSCPAKQGNPFGPFWDHFDVDFSGSATYSSNLRFSSSKQEWDRAFPLDQNFVLAFMGAPASYPVSEANRHLQKYIEWSDKINHFTSSFIASNLQRPYLGIHLRNGMDWKRACEHVDIDGSTFPFMSSPQCTGYGKTRKKFTREMCLPSTSTVLKQTLEAAKLTSVRSLFVATDSDSLKNDFRKLFREAGLSIEVVTLGYDALEKDLALLIEADNFLGSCGSSVTGFVVRKRETLKKPYSFYGVIQTPKSEL